MRVHGIETPTAFAHGVEVAVSRDLILIASYHVSQQNTFTGRLTPAMFDAVLDGCKRKLD
jgi:uracil-DNA glycosylase